MAETELSKAELAVKKHELREKARTDPFFLAELLGYDFQRGVHDDLFNVLPLGDRKTPFFDASPDKNRLILWPRGHYKTSAVVLRIVQLILCFPDIRILVMQATLKLTRGWVAEIASHFNGKNQNSRLPELFPEFCGEKLGTASGFTCPARTRKHLKETTVTAASPKATATGQHYDAFFADDLVNTSNFRNVELLDKLENEFFNFKPLLDPGGYTVVTGTRYHFADLYGRIIKNPSQWLISVRGAYDENGVLLFKQVTLPSGRKIGFTREILDSIQQEIDPETFFAQYHNKIIPTGTQLFPEELILAAVRSTKDEQFPVHAPCYLVVDPATGDSSTADDSVVAACKREQTGRTWVLDCVGGRLSPFALATLIIKMALEHRPVAVLVENAANATFLIAYLQNIFRERGINLPVEPIKAKNNKGAKHLRISALEGSLKVGRLLLLPFADFEKFKDQFVQYPKARHDDYPDVIALLMEYFVQNGGTVMPALIVTNVPHFALLPYDQPEEKANGGPLGFGFNC